MGTIEPGSWLDSAWRVIDAVDASLPKDATHEQRRKALFDAYPFGERRYHPYKMWLKAQRQYLARFVPEKESKRFPLSPLERMLARSSQEHGIAAE